MCIVRKLLPLQRLLGSNILSAEEEKGGEDKDEESRGEIVYDLDKACLLLCIYYNYSPNNNKIEE